VNSRQSAERRYLQLRRDLDDIAGRHLTQQERVEAARTQRDRDAERQWAAEHSREIVGLARQLAAIDNLQERADSCLKAARANHVAQVHAERAGKPAPAPVRIPWPASLVDAVQIEQAHQDVGPSPADDDLKQEADPERLSRTAHTRLVHKMFSLIGYAIDSDNVDLDDYGDLLTAIRELYAAAGPHAPRAPEDLAPPDQA
jgi:hypothetical protein